MNKINMLVAVVFCGLVLSACSLTTNTNRKPTSTPAPTATPTEVVKKNTEKYDPAVIEAYVNACAKNGAKQKFCQCTIDSIESKYTLVEFMEFAKRIAAKDMPTEITKISMDCLPYNK